MPTNRDLEYLLWIFWGIFALVILAAIFTRYSEVIKISVVSAFLDALIAVLFLGAVQIVV